jgi:hypothetical protein
MSEKDPSGALPEVNRVPQHEVAAPGGAFPQNNPPANPAPVTTAVPRQNYLYFLISAIKKSIP